MAAWPWWLAAHHVGLKGGQRGAQQVAVGCGRVGVTAERQSNGIGNGQPAEARLAASDKQGKTWAKGLPRNTYQPVRPGRLRQKGRLSC